jgi:hypothetical protein
MNLLIYLIKIFFLEARFEDGASVEEDAGLATELAEDLTSSGTGDRCPLEPKVRTPKEMSAVLL